MEPDGQWQHDRTLDPISARLSNNRGLLQVMSLTSYRAAPPCGGGWCAGAAGRRRERGLPAWRRPTLPHLELFRKRSPRWRKAAFRSPRDRSALAKAGRFRSSCATPIATLSSSAAANRA